MREDPAGRIRKLQQQRRQEYEERMKLEAAVRAERKRLRKRWWLRLGLPLIVVILCLGGFALFQGDLLPTVSSTLLSTATPAAPETPLPTAAPTPTLTPRPTPAPTPVPTPVAEVKASDHITNEQVYVGETLTTDYVRSEPIDMGPASEYTTLKGVTTFRGNNQRTGASYGTAVVTEEKLEVAWVNRISALGRWTGVGWNGSPAIVQWPDEVRSIMNLYPDKQTKAGLTEIIYATLDGRIYFYDLADGTATRDPILLGYPIKGSVTVDPRGYPLLYTGQGIASANGVAGSIGFHIYSLLTGEKLYFLNGHDEQALRNWYAFDSVALVDGNTDTVIEGGENGLFYTLKLNTQFDIKAKTLSIDPEVVKRQYAIDGRLGIENSVAVYGSLAYFADNSGLFHCVNLNTMKALWVRDVTDDTDATPLIDLEDGYPMVYTACEVDHQGAGGKSYIRKLDGLTGALIWEVAVDCVYNGTINSGALGSPVLGTGDLNGYIIFNINQTKGIGVGSLITALDKDTGKPLWETTLKSYSWSSPLIVTTDAGKSYVVQCDSWGNVHLMDGKTGKILDTITLSGNIEGSPAAFGNTIVVGTRGQQIAGIQIK